MIKSVTWAAAVMVLHFAGFLRPVTGGCVQFWAGLCPGSSDCQCTTGHTCTAPGFNASALKPPVRKDGGCAGTCRQVVHDRCPGSTECLWELGPCGAGPVPPPPHPPHPSPNPPPNPPGPAPGSHPVGPDVSSYQGHVDWNKVKGAGAGFGICKATEGTSFTDSYFKINWDGMEQAGIRVRGAYHFGHPSVSAQSQASHFASVVGKPGSGQFLVLDIESATSEMVRAGNWTAQTQGAVADWCVDFVKAVMSQTGVGMNRMWVYTGAWFWNPSAGGSSLLSSHPLWVSGYSASPPLPTGWSSWTMWQYTDRGPWPGIPGGTSDTSRFHGSQAELEALVA